MFHLFILVDSHGENISGTVEVINKKLVEVSGGNQKMSEGGLGEDWMGAFGGLGVRSRPLQAET